MLSSKVRTVVVCGLAMFALGLASVGSADIIGVKLAAEYGGTTFTAGVVPAPNWNGFPTGGFTGAALHDSTNTPVPGLTASLSVAGIGPTGTAVAVNFGNADDNALMGSMEYAATNDGYIQLKFDGALPYAVSDVYVYSTSGLGGPLPQGVQILSGTGGDLGLNKVAIDLTPTATSYIETGDGVTPGDYVVFKNVPTSLLGTSFIVRVGGGAPADYYACLQGVQIVGVVPEPGTIVLLGTGLLGLLCYAWRKRK